jgi:lactoylglutathione lyase
MKYLHTMIRVSDPDATIRFFELLGLQEVKRMDSEKGRFSLIFWPRPATRMRRSSSPIIGTRRAMTAAAISATSPIASTNIYETCQRLMDAGVTINRPPRDGHMAFVRTPDNISIELLQDGICSIPPSPGPRCPTSAAGNGHGAWRDRRFLTDLFGIDAPIVQAPMAGARRGARDRRDQGRRARIASLRVLSPIRCAHRWPRFARLRPGRSTSTSSATQCRSGWTIAAWRAALQPYYAEYGVGAPAEPPAARRPFDKAMCARWRM